jgi:hypothetical protein
MLLDFVHGGLTSGLAFGKVVTVKSVAEELSQK